MAQPYVSVGDGFAPSASRENALSRLLNFQNGFHTPETGSVTDYSCIPCYNSTADTLPLGATVMINDSMVVDDGVVPIKLASADAVLWGILLDELAPNSCGTLFVSGVLPFELAGIKTGSYLSPNGQGGLIASDAGRAMYFMEHILLGGGGGAPTGYTGPFSVKYNADRTKLIVKGGFIDLYGYYPDTELTPYQYDTIGILAKWSDSENKYLVKVSSEQNGYFNAPGTLAYPQIGIAYIDKNLNIVQNWLKGGVLFRELFIV